MSRRLSKTITVLTFALLMAFLMGAGCESTKSFLEVSNTTLLITGRVVSFDTVTKTYLPVEGGTVYLKSDSTMSALTQSDDAKTIDINEAGWFSLDGVPANSNDLWMIVVKEGYTSYTNTIDTFNAAAPISNLDGQFRQLDLGDIELVTNDGTLSGMVFGSSGGLANVSVICENDITKGGDPSAGGFYASTLSLTDGSFSFTAVPKAPGYTCFNLPVDTNADGFNDYGSTAVTVSLDGVPNIDVSTGTTSFSSVATNTRANLVLPSISASFGVVYSNVGHGWDTTGSNLFGPAVLGNDDNISMYFNNVVSDDVFLQITLVDINGRMIPVSTSVNTTSVTIDPLEPFIAGFNYTMIYQAQSITGERQSATGITFWVLDDTSPSAISDLAFNRDDSEVANGLTTDISTFDELVDTTNGAGLDASIVLGFTLPTNYTHISLHVRNDDPDSAFMHFDTDKSGAQLFTIAEPTDYGNPATNCAVPDASATPPVVACASTVFATGGSGILSTNVESADKDAKIVVSGLGTAGFFSGLTFTGETDGKRKIFMVLQACNEVQIGSEQAGISESAVDGSAFPDASDNCTFSNIVELEYIQ